MKTKSKKISILAALAVGLAGSAMAAESLWDNFDSYNVGTNLTALSAQGWGASDAGVIVTNNLPGHATQFAELPPYTIATNVKPAGLKGKVWTDCTVTETMRVDPSTLPLTNTPATVVMVGVTTDGYAVVYNAASNGWDVCTNDARGTSLGAGLAAAAWAQISVCEDFDNTNVAVFLNNRLLREKIPFITVPASYSGLRFKSGVDSTGYVDNVYVSNSIPAALTNVSATTDINGDGLPDAVELVQYGVLAKMVPGDISTIPGAIAASLAGDRIVVSNATYVTSFTLSNKVILVGRDLSGSYSTNLTIQGNMTVVTGTVFNAVGTFTVTGQVNVVAGGLLTISNTAASLGGLVIGSGGHLQVVNGILTADGVTLTGTFTLDSGWGGSLTRSSLNYTNDFESYPTNMPLALCGGQGWGASDSGSIIQGLVVTQQVKAAMVADHSALSNTVSATGVTKAWTDIWLNDSAARVSGFPYPSTNANRAVMLFVNTNNHVVIWNSTFWDECTQDVAGASAPTVATGQWVRVTVFEDFTVPQKVALFLNGQLVRQQVPFIAPVPSYQGLMLSAGASAAYLDDVKIWTNVPTGLTNGAMSDLDRDGIADAVEIVQYGSTLVLPRGSVFKIR